MCQSSNDVFPRRPPLVLYRGETGGLLDALATLEAAVRERMALGPVVRIGRTVPSGRGGAAHRTEPVGYASLLEHQEPRSRHSANVPPRASSAPPPWARGSACDRLHEAHLPQTCPASPGSPCAESPTPSTDAKFRRRHDPVRARPQRGGGLRQDRPRLPVAVFRPGVRHPGNWWLGPGFPDSGRPPCMQACHPDPHQVGANDWAIGMAAQSWSRISRAFGGGIKLIALLESLELTRNAAPLLAEACVQRLEADGTAPPPCRIHVAGDDGQRRRGTPTGQACPYRLGGADLRREAAVREGLFSPDAARELFDVHAHGQALHGTILSANTADLIQAPTGASNSMSHETSRRGPSAQCGPVPLRRPDAGQQAYL